MNNDIIKLFEGMQVEEFEPEPNGRNYATISFWLTKEYRTKYNSLQKRTKREFGRRITELIRESIDLFESEQDAG